MSYYYQYKFASPDPLYARVKEELKSYFEAGMVDDVLFPLWTKDCLRRLGRGSFKIESAVLFQEGFEAKLPPDFIDVREAWLIAGLCTPTFRKPGSYYTQITTALNKPYDPCNALLACDPCNPEVLTFTTKTNTEIFHEFKLKYLLTPGNIHAKERCDHGCLNWGVRGTETFDIRDGKLITEFRQGDVLLIYYSNQKDESGYELIPCNYWIEDFLRKYLKARIFEILFNQITDESFQQMQFKYTLFQQQADEAFIRADIETKKQTLYQKAYRIRREIHRFDKYKAGLDDMHRDWRWGRHGWPASSWGFND